VLKIPDTSTLISATSLLTVPQLRRNTPARKEIMIVTRLGVMPRKMMTMMDASVMMTLKGLPLWHRPTYQPMMAKILLSIPIER
jgi:hypothetical protein